ncbi:MAG: metalloregulator ArsR/SmtB family transcription factor [Anaerolineaceae bacterium]|jgi:predicted transcriptional regulator|nr:metalloregulator ArsR/SmtB family transcription factor [Anaerolineaceae bacterium]
MTDAEFNEKLLTFFKALADEQRLKIVGLLAQREYGVEELAETLGLGVSTTSHHLARLSKAGLVSARAEGHYFRYRLQTETLKEMSAQLTHEEMLPQLSNSVGDDLFERKVMTAFTDSEGRIKAFPEKEKKLLVLLNYVLQAFEPGKRYSERELNEILKRYNADTAFLRRSLVEYKLMGREGGGGEYWRL